MIRVRYAVPDDPQDSAEEVFDRVLGLAGWTRNSLRQSWSPPVDVLETQSGLMVVVALPGVHEDDLSVTIRQDRLRISGLRRPLEGAHYTGALQLEIDYGAFDRTLQLPHDADVDHVEAHFRNGLLALQIPRRAAARTIRIRPEHEGDT